MSDPACPGELVERGRRVVRLALATALVTAGAIAGTSTGAAASGTAPATTVSITTGPAVTATLGRARSLPPGYFGFNFDYGGAREYAVDPGVDSQLAALEPGTLRYPGGTYANFFQWKLGLPVNPSAGQCLTSHGSIPDAFTLSDLLAAYKQTKAPPVFDLNVMTSTLACQEAMLQTAKRLGLPVRYVELGNELYMNFNRYPHYFPTAADYGTVVASYVKAIHASFPGAQVAAVGALLADTPRERTWNRDMLAAARQAGGLPDAITLHVYAQYQQALTPGELPELFSEPYQKVRLIRSVTAALSVQLPTWLTEYNLQPRHLPNSNPAQNCYAAALVAAELDLLLVHRISSSQLTDYFAAFGPSASYAETGPPDRPALTPAGLALTWTDEAAHGATRSRAAVFSGAPVLSPGGFPALIGEFFSSSGTRRGMLLNLSPRVLNIKAGTAIRAGATYMQATFAGNPAQQVDTASKLTIKHGTVGTSLAMPAYSIIMIQ